MKRFPFPNEALSLPWTTLAELFLHVYFKFFAAPPFIALNTRLGLCCCQFYWLPTLDLDPVTWHSSTVKIFTVHLQRSMKWLMIAQWVVAAWWWRDGDVMAAQCSESLNATRERTLMRMILFSLVWLTFPQQVLRLNFIINMSNEPCCLIREPRKKLVAHKMTTGPHKGDKNA